MMRKLLSLSLPHLHHCALLTLAALSVVLTGCKHEPDQGEVAAHSAQTYYNYLLNHDYKSFVEGTYLPDSIPASFREQLETNAKMFLAQQDTEHRGIKSVQVQGGVADTAAHTANVFLLLQYGDSTAEKIVVPMVQDKGVWYMR